MSGYNNPYAFNPLDYALASGGSNSLPLGQHVVVIIAAEVKATRDNANNGRLELMLQVIDGASKNAVGAYNLNLLHSTSEDAARIARQQLSTLCCVTGTTSLNDFRKPVELFGKPFMVRVQPQKKDPEYLEISTVMFADGRPASRDTQQQAAPPPPQQQAPQQFAQPQQALPQQYAPQQPAQYAQQPQQAPQQPQQAPQPNWNQPPPAGTPQQAAQPNWNQAAPTDKPAWA